MELNTTAEYAAIEPDQSLQNSFWNTQTLNQYERPDNIATSGTKDFGGNGLPTTREEARVAFGEGEVLAVEDDAVKILITDSDGQQEVYHIVKKTFLGWVDSESVAEGVRYKVNLVDKNSRKQLEFVPYPAPFISSSENFISKEQRDADIKDLRDSLGRTE